MAVAIHRLPQSKGRLAIIAGAGTLPHHVAEAARLQGEDPFIIALSREADTDWTGFDHAVCAIGDFAAISRTFETEESTGSSFPVRCGDGRSGAISVLR